MATYLLDSHHNFNSIQTVQAEIIPEVGLR